MTGVVSQRPVHSKPIDLPRKSFGVFSHFACMGVVAFCLALLSSGCAPGSSLSAFKFNSNLLSSTSTTMVWGTAGTIDNGSGSAVNSDTSATSCLAGAGVLLDSTVNTAGCLQSPALIYSSRWMAGFMQVNSLTFFGSIYSSITSLTTGQFSVPVTVDDTLNGSARYVRYAKLPNGNVVAVFMVENIAGTVRSVYANVFTSSTGLWGTAVLMSTAGAETDVGSDGLPILAGMRLNTHKAVLCRPTVAAAGDNSAMVSWCEGSSPDSQVMYRYYNAGSWTPIIGSPGTAIAASSSALAFPGFIGQSTRFDQFDTDGDATVETTYTFTVDDVILFRYIIAGVKYYVPLKAVLSPPGINEFQISYSGASVLVCTTMQGMINAALSAVPYTFAADTAQTSTLSSLGFSMKLDPTCSETNTATQNVTVYYNKAGNGVFWDSTASNTYSVELPDNTLSSQSTFRLCRNGEGAVDDSDDCYVAATWSGSERVLNFMQVFNPISANGAAFASQFDWRKSTMVSVAGDGSGNYAMVRSTVAPVFKNSGILNVDVDYGHVLVGQEYSATTGWKTVTPTSTTYLTKKISGSPSCLGSSEYSACSVRNPKILMSNVGKGLVLYHQNQPTSYDGTNFRNRLWFTTYSVGSGFVTGGASILDDNTICSTSSVTNDVPVCETGSFTRPCQALNESQTITAGLQGTRYDTTPTASAGSIDQDVPPISAAMNANGNAIVGYHKMYNSGTLTSPVCSTFSTYVRLYSSTSGFESAKQVDSGVGNTMHAQVAIDSAGTAAVVWEEVRSGVVYLYFRKYESGSWGSAVALASNSTATTDALMPSVEISDTEIMVSYSLGQGATRRQYAIKYTR